VRREEGEGKVSEESVATAAVAGSRTLGRRRTGLAPGTGSTPALKSRRERCMRRRSDVHYWSVGKSKRKFRLTKAGKPIITNNWYVNGIIPKSGGLIAIIEQPQCTISRIP
jgi:hypothetical protein